MEPIRNAGDVPEFILHFALMVARGLDATCAQRHLSCLKEDRRFGGMSCPDPASGFIPETSHVGR